MSTPEEQKKYQAKWYQDNKHWIAPKEKEEYDPVKKRNTMLLYKYDMTLQDYADLLEYQGGGCAICGVKEDQSYDHMPVDHCSKTGKVRGILCSHCNRGIGLFEHNTDMMNDAIEYMKNPHAQDLWEYEEMPDSPPTLPID